MPRRFTDIPDHLREPHEIEVRGFWNVYVIAIGVVILLGLLTGSIWIAWRLVGARLGL
jgi:hypothetical protein